MFETLNNDIIRILYCNQLFMISQKMKVQMRFSIKILLAKITRKYVLLMILFMIKHHFLGNPLQILVASFTKYGDSHFHFSKQPDWPNTFIKLESHFAKKLILTPFLSDYYVHYEKIPILVACSNK